MRKKLSLLLVMIMAMTMILGTGITAMAGEINTLNISVSVPPSAGTSAADVINGILVSANDALVVNLNGPDYDHSLANTTNFIELDGGSTVNTLEEGKDYVLYIAICKQAQDDFGPSVFIPTISGVEYSNLSSYPENSYYVVSFKFHVGGSGGSGGSGNGGSSSSTAPSHVHSFQYGIIYPATKDADGLEGEVCSCGATRNTQPISAMAYALYDYALPMINASKPGQTITFEFKEWNSFPRAFMEKIAAKSAEGVTFVFHYNWNHVKQEITIPAGTEVSLEFDWNGPAKMAELYGLN